MIALFTGAACAALTVVVGTVLLVLSVPDDIFDVFVEVDGT